MTPVLDASSLLAFLHDEPGAERVWSALPGAMVSAVNWSEVVQKSLQRQADIAGMREDFEQTGVSFMPFTAQQAEIAALLWDKTRLNGLSLGDRACLALAMERHAPILTADRAWAGLSLGLEIELIR
ncbi:PIN domain-containing protein [Immundisolibacter sp.]|uniref:PIN domain-containing protein n=1 Tax=Immundisolibacter sp. TaxID=1934948 RepID=UPI0026237F06|nr:type II toxin-antitoxin system VapC family toxin [Immundisolibacter sp.]MDD3651209.1 type II toxin-antitoxin system VapC family toxin [Immundisolibacter sp.]